MNLDIILIQYLSNGNYTSLDIAAETRMRLLAFYLQEMQELESRLNFLINENAEKDANKAYHLGFSTGMIQLIMEEIQQEHDILLELSKIPTQHGVANPTKSIDV